MTDYNDGNWHGWNGGDCPVHPSTVVEVTWSDGDKWTGDACLNVWNVVQLFRVVKKHKEPREYWVSRLTSIAYISYREALYEGCHPEFLDHVKEVLEE
jgi:hypothetical protein